MVTGYEDTQNKINALLEKNLFFIVGCQKSGTTWLQHLLNGHPEIWCSGEAHFGNQLVPILEKAVDYYNQWSAHKNKTLYKTNSHPHFTQSNVDYLIASCVGLLLDGWKDKQNVKCVGEKTPDTIQAIDLFGRIFPGAKFVHIIRDGRDAAVSAWFHFPTINPEFHKQFPTLDDYVGVFANNWAQAIRLGRNFGARNPDRYIDVKYEELLLNTHQTGKCVLEFLEVDSSEKSINACIDAGDFRKLSKGRAPGEEDKDSHFRKGVAGDWKNHFTRKTEKIFANVAGNILKQLEYQ